MSETKLASIHLAGSRFSRSFTCRIALILMVLNGVVACAGVETQPAPPVVIENVVRDDGLANANTAYNARDYDAALKEFKAITQNQAASVNSRRMAYLGEALIYLSSDKQWRSLENAKMALRSAGQVAPTEDEGFLLTTDMMMDAITISIGTESRYAELQSKSGNSSSEVVRLKAERDALLAENTKLRKDQVALNEALERLKNLTLGN